MARYTRATPYPNRTIPGKDVAAAEDFDRSGLFMVMQSGQMVLMQAPGTTHRLVVISKDKSQRVALTLPIYV